MPINGEDKRAIGDQGLEDEEVRDRGLRRPRDEKERDLGHRQCLRDKEVGGRRPRRSVESSTRLPADSSAACYPSWVILNRVGSRGDFLHYDASTWATSCTTTADLIAVSLELVEPPATSLLILHWPEGPDPRGSNLAYPYLIAAHASKLLFQITIPPSRNPDFHINNYFVFQADARANSDPSPQPQLFRLPTCTERCGSSVHRPVQHIMDMIGTGIMSCNNGSFIVAELDIRSPASTTANLWLFYSYNGRCECGMWNLLEHLTIRNASSDMSWWETDATFCYGQHIIWVDYYRGMIFAELSNPEDPKLWYVQLPVEPMQGNPEHPDFGRGNPEATRSVCVSDSHIKFVFVDGVAYKSFNSITIWSLDNDYRWRKDIVLTEAQLWSVDSTNSLPHTVPRFPVVSIENPNVIYFKINNAGRSADLDPKTWLVEIDVDQKVLLRTTSYKDGSLFHQNNYKSKRSSEESNLCHETAMIRPKYGKCNKSARKMSETHPFITSSISFYVYEKEKM